MNRVETLPGRENVYILRKTTETVCGKRHPADDGVWDLFFFEALRQARQRFVHDVPFHEKVASATQRFTIRHHCIVGPYTTSPPTTVIRTFALNRSDCGMAKRSPSTMVRSASLPGSMVPRDCSSNAANAASRVKPRIASARVSFWDGYQPPAGQP